MPAFPPAEVTTLTVQPSSYPVTFEYVGQAIGSKDAEVRARVTGIVEKRLYQEGAIGARPGSRCSRSIRGPTRRSSHRPRRRSRAPRLKGAAPSARSRGCVRSPSAGRSARRRPTMRNRRRSSPPRQSSPPRRRPPRRGSISRTRALPPRSPGISSRAQQSEGSIATANQTLLTTVSQVDPIWVGFSVSENERLKLERARAEGRLKLPQRQRLSGRVQAGRRFALPAHGPHQFRGHAHQSADRNLRAARDRRQCRRAR